MKLKNRPKHLTTALYACGVITFGILLFFLVQNIGWFFGILSRFFTIINPVIYGFVIAFIINPLVRLFEGRVFAHLKDKNVYDASGTLIGIRSRRRARRVLSILVSYLIILTIIVTFITMLVPQVINSYGSFDTKLASYVSGAQRWAESIVNSTDKKDGIMSWLISKLDIDRLSASVNAAMNDSYSMFHKITPYVVDFVRVFIDSVKNSLIGIIISIYFLYSKEHLCAQMRKVLYAICRSSTTDRLLRVTRRTSASFEKFLTGKLMDSLIIGVLTFFVLLIFNIPYYPLVAVIVGITNIIPFFGPFIGAIPSAFIIFVADPLKCIWFIIIIIIIQQLDGNVIGPRILGGQTGLSALWVVISIIVMGGIMGITGMLIGVPVIAVIYSLFAEFIAARLEKKNKALFSITYTDVKCYEDIPDIEQERQMLRSRVPEIKRPKLTELAASALKKLFKPLISKLRRKNDGKKTRNGGNKKQK